MKSSLHRPILALSLWLGMLPAWSQTIPNPSFEADAFTVWPGYISGNVPITGWLSNFESSQGINPAPTSPFADNGVVPQGSNVAFIQSNSNDSSLETTISGLTAGQTYQLSFRANARNGNVAWLNLLVDGTMLLSANVSSVGGTNPYRTVTTLFTATATTAALTVKNVAGGDNTLLIDDFSVVAAANPWSYAQWFDDATSGLDSTYVYTHAYNFGSGASFLLNGVPFTGAGGGNPAVAGKLALGGFDGVFGNDGNNLADGSRALANDFIYNGFPGTVTLSGLTPGQSYQLSLFSVGWEGPGVRAITFSGGGQNLSVDQDTFDNNNGIRVDYNYVADSAGTATIQTKPLQGASFHLYGLANRGVVVSPTPVVTYQPQGKLAFTGQTVTFVGSAAGAAPIGYKWYRNGVEIAGATSSTLEIPLTSAATQAGFYTFRATNGAGTILSNAAFLEVYEPVVGAAFNTGMDAGGLALVSGDVDPHYAIVDNPDNVDVPDAFVQDPFAFPIVAGPWLANSETSLWIGPRQNTAGAAGPDPTYYIYRTTLDLTGKGTSGLLSGGFAADNGVTLKINDVAPAGVAVNSNFGAYTPISVWTESLPAGTLTSGLNNLDFRVVNNGAGYTGLKVDGLTYSVVPAGIAPVVVTQPVGGSIISGTTVTLNTHAYGTASLAYQWTRNGANLPGATGTSYTISSFGSAQNGDYAVRVTNPHGTVTSNVAALVASNVPPTIATAPASVDAVLGESATFTVSAEGSSPFSYQWIFQGADIAGATDPSYTVNPVAKANAGKYKVRVTNAYGTVTSAEASLSAFTLVPGLYNSGVDDTGAALLDGESDNHYTLVVNPGGVDMVPATVHSSTIFPIVAGPWLANNASCKWIAPLDNSAGAGGLAYDAGEGPGTFVYRTTVDLTGFYLPSVKIVGNWSTDNFGTVLRVNGQPTGNVNTAQFVALTPFSITASNAAFVEGVNTIDFLVQNVDATAGYTALRVENIRAVGYPQPLLPTLYIAMNGSQQPVISFNGVQGVNYSIQRSTTLSGDWVEVGTAVGGAQGAVQFTDTAAPVGRGYYRVSVPVL